jgi:hypothetical protein
MRVVPVKVLVPPDVLRLAKSKAGMACAPAPENTIDELGCTVNVPKLLKAPVIVKLLPESTVTDAPGWMSKLRTTAAPSVPGIKDTPAGMITSVDAVGKEPHQLAAFVQEPLPPSQVPVCFTLMVCVFWDVAPPQPLAVTVKVALPVKVGFQEMVPVLETVLPVPEMLQT